MHASAAADPPIWSPTIEWVVCLSDTRGYGMETPRNYQPLERRKVYEQIAEQLLGQIGSRALRPGDALPPERAGLSQRGCSLREVRS